MEEDLRRKAILTLGGGVRLPEGFTLPCRISHSTAGPGAGFGSFAFSFNGYRVKKSVSYETGEFELHEDRDGKLSLTHNGEPFIDSITIEPVVRHCPEQAFFNLDPRCIFHGAYCNSPLLDISLKDSGIRDNYKCMVIGLEEGKERLSQVPPSRKFRKGDIVWIVGEEENLKLLMD